MNFLAQLAGRLAACSVYGVKLGYEYGTSAGMLPGTEYGPQTLEQRSDDPKRVKDQVDMLFTNFPTIDPDSHFPMPGTTNQFAG